MATTPGSGKPPPLLAGAFWFAVIVCGLWAIGHFSSSSRAPDESTASTPTPVPPNRADIEKAVSVAFSEFRRLQKVSSQRLSRPVLSDAFFRNSRAMAAVTEYTSAEKLTDRIDDVRDRTVDISSAYDSVSNSKTLRFSFIRHDTWTFVHGAAGWLIDTMHVNDRIITAVALSGQRRAVTDSNYDAATGQLTFTDQGEKLAWIPTKDGGWHVTVLSTRTPQPVFVPPPPQAVATVPPGYVVLPAAPANGCQEVGVNGVYDDGKVLALDDGRHLRVYDYDTPTSSVWVAPFDGLVCDGGDRFINKDDNEGVDLQP